MIAKEVHYRLLTASFGGMLRSLIRYDSAASAVANAIGEIRRRFRESLVVADLARRVGMSVSAFHRQFKAVTALSPLQYQKDLRLLEARRHLRGPQLASPLGRHALDGADAHVDGRSSRTASAPSYRRGRGSSRSAQRRSSSAERSVFSMSRAAIVPKATAVAVHG